MTWFESDPGDEQPEPARFWPEPDWHANGLPTPEELKARNRWLRAMTDLILREHTDTLIRLSDD